MTDVSDTTVVEPDAERESAAARELDGAESDLRGVPRDEDVDPGGDLEVGSDEDDDVVLVHDDADADGDGDEPVEQTGAVSNVIELRPRSGAGGGVHIVPVVRHEPGDVREERTPEAPLEHQLEALLFVSPTPLTVEALAGATGEDPDDLSDCLIDMMSRYAEGTSGIVLERVAGGWAFRASDRTRDQLAQLIRPQADTKLSPSALETLAIVGYLQPISRPDVARIRGVSVDAAMSSLLERGFVEEAGRSESGAVLFRTTALFERAFGLSSIGALPDLEGFGPSDDERARLREQLEQMAAARVD